MNRGAVHSQSPSDLALWLLLYICFPPGTSNYLFDTKAKYSASAGVWICSYETRIRQTLKGKIFALCVAESDRFFMCLCSTKQAPVSVSACRCKFGISWKKYLAYKLTPLGKPVSSKQEGALENRTNKQISHKLFVAMNVMKPDWKKANCLFH